MSYGFSISNQTNSNSKFKVLLAATRTIAIWIWLSVKKSKWQVINKYSVNAHVISNKHRWFISCMPQK